MEARVKESDLMWGSAIGKHFLAGPRQTEETKYRMSSSNHAETVLTNIHKLWEQESGLDVTLVAQNREIRAHRLIIRAASTYFCRHLPKDSTKDVYIMLPNVEFEYLEYMIQFIYNGQVTIPQSKMNNFVNMANEFGLINPNQAQHQTYVPVSTNANDANPHSSQHPHSPEPDESTAVVNSNDGREEGYLNERSTPIIENVSSLAELTLQEDNGEIFPQEECNGTYSDNGQGLAASEETCHLCQRVFPTPDSLGKHYRACKRWRGGVKTGTELDIACPNCPQKFYSKSSFYYHMRTSQCKDSKLNVAIDRKFSPKSLTANIHCRYCSYRTYSRKGLKIHLGHRHRENTIVNLDERNLGEQNLDIPELSNTGQSSVEDVA